MSDVELLGADLQGADLSGADQRRTGSAGVEEAAHKPLYGRMLRLRHLSPSGVLCFVFLEGAIALGILLALAELVSWWGVLVLPATVAVMVKLNDLIPGMLARPETPVRPVAARAAVPGSDDPGAVLLGEESTTRLPGVGRPAEGGLQPWAERLETHQQRMRQSATRRYE
ncbi:hypothetical protein ACWKSP_23580 [Micromonosporaceae bacterium Da 78-11]